MCLKKIKAESYETHIDGNHTADSIVYSDKLSE